MTIKILKTESEYLQALDRADEIFNALPGTPDGDELELLLLVIEEFEKHHYPISEPDPVEAIKFEMEQKGINQKGLAKILGLDSRASEILNRKRKLSLSQIRVIHKKLKIPADVLIKE